MTQLDRAFCCQRTATMSVPSIVSKTITHFLIAQLRFISTRGLGPNISETVRYRSLDSKGQPIGNGLRRVEWPRDQ